MKQFIISEAIRNGLLRYLVTRPHEEVDAGVRALVELKEFDLHKALLDDAETSGAGYASIHDKPPQPVGADIGN